MREAIKSLSFRDCLFLSLFLSRVNRELIELRVLPLSPDAIRCGCAHVEASVAAHESACYAALSVPYAPFSPSQVIVSSGFHE